MLRVKGINLSIRYAVAQLFACVRRTSAIVLFVIVMTSFAPHSLPEFAGTTTPDDPYRALDCVYDSGYEPTLESNLDVLNCLVVRTPGAFWKNANSLKQCIDESKLIGHVRDACHQLAYGNWACSFLPVEGPVPACLRHDVAYSSLQQFVGGGGRHVLDGAWNPRNKHLADTIFRDDLDKAFSGDSWAQRLSRNTQVSALLHWFVNKANNKTWPMTYHDIQDTKDRPYFRRCTIPQIENVVIIRNGRVYQAEWNYVPGCVKDITVDYYKLCWKIELPEHPFASYSKPSEDFCRYTEGHMSTDRFTVPPGIRTWESVTLQSVEIRPSDIDYGGPLGSAEFLGNKALEPIFQGAYYPKQHLELTISNE